MALKTFVSVYFLKDMKSKMRLMINMCSHCRLKQERKCVKPLIANGFHLHVLCSYFGHCFCVEFEFVNH